MTQATEKQILLTAGETEAGMGALSVADSSAPLARIPESTQGLLTRMFADPYLLEKSERATLVAELREVVSDNAEASELRVLLGMALCVNFEVPDAIEELNEAVRLAPQSYIAHLKAGELWMRLRVVGKAEEHTRQAALLASNMAQSELARRQAATIRTMRRNGIERGIQSCKTPGRALASIARRFWKKRSEPDESSVALDLT